MEGQIHMNGVLALKGHEEGRGRPLKGQLKELRKSHLYPNIFFILTLFIHNVEKGSNIL